MRGRPFFDGGSIKELETWLTDNEKEFTKSAIGGGQTRIITFLYEFWIDFWGDDEEECSEECSSGLANDLAKIYN